MFDASIFDRPVDRRGSNCLKFDFAAERGMPEDLLPMWVADMDFIAPQGVIDAIRVRTEHGIFGYSDVKSDYYDAVADWFDDRFGWRPEAEWLVKTPGVVCALALAVRALTRPGEAVLVQPPVYYPFYEVIACNGRRVAENPLTLRDGRYEIDFDGFEAAASAEDVKLFMLCSPHNPVGRVWTEAELRRIGEICLRHNVAVISDEIHCDFTREGHPHTPLLKAVPELRDRAIVCTAPSKTFNLAGLQVSNIWIPDEAIRERFQAEIACAGYSQLNCFGLTACQAAYRTGAAWLDALKVYLEGNLAYLRGFLADNLPKLRLIEPEGTYLAWVDFSGLGLTPDELDDLIVNRAKLWLDAGRIFGKASAQFERFVLACPRSTLVEAMVRLKRAVDGLPKR